MITIEEKHYKTISKIVKDYAGIVLERIPQKRIEKKLLEQMQFFNCQDINNYIDLLKDNATNSLTIDNFIGEITISESYIFRNPKQFEYLIKNFFPNFFKENDYKYPMRIWSAGCSHGEEPYSLAMITKDFQQKHPKAKFTINAGDINKNSLKTAKNGVYDSNSLHGKIEFFEKMLGFSIGKYDENGNCNISEDLKEKVDFHWLNLKNISSLKIMQGSDIIFCRNVLIYFDDVLRNKLLNKFFDCLNPKGLLFIGESECFKFPDKRFELLDNQGSYAYRKPESR